MKAPGRREARVHIGINVRDAVQRHRDMVFRIAYTYLRDAADAACPRASQAEGAVGR